MNEHPPALPRAPDVKDRRRACENLPPRVNANLMAKHFLPGDPVIVLVVKGIGSTEAYELRDREGRSYLLNWELRLDGHVLRLPWHLWMRDEGKLAHAILDQRRLPFAVVVLVETTEGCKAAAEEVRTETRSEAAAKDDVLHHPRLFRLLKDGAVRVKTAARALNMTEKRLRAVLARPECPAELKNPGWVRMKLSIL